MTPTRVKRSLNAGFVFTQLVPLVWSLSLNCSQFTVVPGSVYNFAYNDGNGVKTTRDANWCNNNILQSSTLPILRDLLTQQYVANISPWGWIGVYQTDTTNGDANGWVWQDGLSQSARPVSWDIPSAQPYGTGQCAHIAPGAYAWKEDCSKTEHMSCEINGLDHSCFEHHLTSIL